MVAAGACDRGLRDEARPLACRTPESRRAHRVVSCLRLCENDVSMPLLSGVRRSCCDVACTLDGGEEGGLKSTQT